MIVVGDEAGEQGAQLATCVPPRSATSVAAMAMIVAGTRAWHDGARLRARARGPVQRGHGRPVRRPVPRDARAPRAARGTGGASGVPTPGLVEKVMTTKLLESSILSVDYKAFLKPRTRRSCCRTSVARASTRQDRRLRSRTRRTGTRARLVAFPDRWSGARFPRSPRRQSI